MSDEHQYARVVEELRRDGPVAGLWAKAFAESGGVDSAAKAAYLRLRVAQLAEEERRRQEETRQAEVRTARDAAAANARAPVDHPGYPRMTGLERLSAGIFVVIVVAIAIALGSALIM